MEKEYDSISILSVFDGITKQIGLLNTYLITSLVKWVCLNYTIAVSRAY